jgi:hypothetical protein
MAKDAPAAPSTGKAILLRFPFEDRFECAILASYTLPAGKISPKASSFYELIQFNSPRFLMAAPLVVLDRFHFFFRNRSRDMSNDTFVRRPLEISCYLNGAGRTLTRKFAA